MYGLGIIVLGTEGAGVGVCVAVDVVDFGVGAVSKTPGVGGGGTLVPDGRRSLCVASFFEVGPVVNCLRLEEGACSVTMICSPLVMGISDSLACGLLVTVDGNALGGYPNFTEGPRINDCYPGEKNAVLTLLGIQRNLCRRENHDLQFFVRRFWLDMERGDPSRVTETDLCEDRG